MIQLMKGDCLERMKEIPDNSIDSIVTDPPYGLSFMGKKWDYDVPSVEIWQECLRVLKPGGHLLAFAGTRTQHRMACRIEDAGFEIMDMMTHLYDANDAANDFMQTLSPEQRKLMARAFSTDGMIGWGYGSGFPKSLNISKAIDKTAPSTDEAKQWDGWGTALKPALEPITVARKPLSEKTVAANVLKHGAGGINIDECRIEIDDNLNGGAHSEYSGNGSLITGDTRSSKAAGMYDRSKRAHGEYIQPTGRFPANLIHDGSEEVLALFPVTHGAGCKREKNVVSDYSASSYKAPIDRQMNRFGDEGSVARFFYCAKTSKKDRGEDNNHPTVKPTELMRYLCRLVTPTGGTVLDPFTGSGSTGKAAMAEGFKFIGIEIDEHYFSIAKSRIEDAKNELTNER